MNRTTLLIFFGCLLGAPIAAAVDITFVTPDGQPARGTKFYRTYQDPGMEEMGMDMMGGMMMGSGGGAEDEMYGMEMGMGDGMGMGGGGGMGMGMGMGPGGMPTAGFPSAPYVAFLDGKPLQPMTPPRGELLTAGDDGSIDLDKGMLVRHRGVSVHAVSALAVHESGFSFIPARTTFSPKVTLRRGGKLIVSPPSGIDASRYQVLTCWQNGFAYPSLEEYKRELNSSQALGKQLDADDWRFSPRFRWYQTAELGEVISVPPGEVRVTIVPRLANAPDPSDRGSAQWFEWLTARGPSTIVVVSGSSPDPITVEFPVLRSLVLRAPGRSDDTLPEWGDQSSPRYYLEPFHRQSFGDTPTLTTPPASAVTSRSTMAKFLNQRRDERAAYQKVRLPSSTDGRNIRFDLLRPGWYVIIRVGDDGLTTRGIPVIDWEQGDGVATAVLAEEKIKGVDGALELAVTKTGQAIFRSDRSAESAAEGSADTRRSDAEKLKLVQTLRRDIEATVARLAKHRKRLMELEATLRRKLLPPNPNQDPFGGPGVMEDPFGGPSGGADPFGGGDPFGEGGGTSSDDPFGGSPQTVEPSGGGASFGADPFGG
ncbi:hypothetical protein [Stieleria magnilauensis]|uniref:Transmembrane protein n=1 Tax=Stieleria magnilauensis TaxID=2527963 RepID=A0ABX5XXG5_9BACT|nr:hypothetical protein TBK1r_57340 [Planctomycetes bacterium TBK1r]